MTHPFVLTKRARIYVAGGGATPVGLALTRRLRFSGYENVFCDDRADLTDSRRVGALFLKFRPEVVLQAAGLSGGIEANRKHPAELMMDNLLSAAHLVREAHEHGVKKLLYLASSCVYPRRCAQPMSTRSLMRGPLEPTSEAYAMAKMAGLTLCGAFRRQYGDRFIVGIPANPFGPGDDFDPTTSHVIPALIRKMHVAKIKRQKKVTIWGSGKARRDFIFLDDLADACLFLIRRYNGEAPVNIGTGTEISIGVLAGRIKDIVGFRGSLQFESSRPEGVARKMLDASPLRRMGWRPKIPFTSALSRTYEWFLRHENH